MRTLVIVPAYNEEQNIVKTILDIQTHQPANTEYLVINDCSTDQTATAH